MSGSLQPTRANSKPLKECQTLQEAFASYEFIGRMNELVPEHVKAGALMRMFMQAASRSPDIYKVPVRQALGQLFTLANLGLEPNNAFGHAYLIPFKEKVWNPQTRKRDIESMSLQLIIGYRGYAELMHRTGLVRTMHADVVLPGDEFDYSYGTGGKCVHRPMGRAEDDATPLYAYAYLAVKSPLGIEGEMFEVMPWTKVLKVRNGSQGYRSALQAREDASGKYLPRAWTEAPWVKHEHEMAKKTPFRALAKMSRMSREVAIASAIDDADESSKRLDWGAMADEKNFGAEIPEADQDGPIIEGTIEPGAAFGMRSGQAEAGKQEEAKPAKPAPQEPQTSKAPAASNPSEIDGESQEAEFEGWLADENGEPESMEPIHDPVAYVRRVEALWQKSSNPETLIENNREALEAAAKLSPEAKQILDTMEEGDPDVDDGKIEQITVDEGRGAGWPAFTKKVEAALSDLNPARLVEWVEVQFPTFERAPQTTKVGIVAHVSKFCTTHGLTTPDTVRNLLRKPSQKPAVEATKEPDKQPETAAPTTQQPEDEAARKAVEAAERCKASARSFFQDVRQAAAGNPDAVTDYLNNAAIRTNLRNTKERFPQIWRELAAALAAAGVVDVLREGAEELYEAVVQEKVRQDAEAQGKGGGA